MSIVKSGKRSNFGKILTHKSRNTQDSYQEFQEVLHWEKNCARGFVQPDAFNYIPNGILVWSLIDYFNQFDPIKMIITEIGLVRNLEAENLQILENKFEIWIKNQDFVVFQLPIDF